MNHKTKNYFTALLLSVIVFSVAKYTINKLNSNNKSIVIPIENKPNIIIKQQPLDPIVKKTNNIIKNRLLVGGSWKSK
jgi:hypothetical protein